MSTPNDGNYPPGPPMPPPGTPGGPTPPSAHPSGPAEGQPAKKTSMPAVSLILSILSFLCLPIILAVAGIITGFIGRGKAKEEGSGTGMATAGIVLGFVNIFLVGIVLAVMAVAGVALFSAVSEQVKVADQLIPASAAADQYRQANGSYSGIDTAALSEFGFRSSSDVTVTAMSSPDGSAYCIEGATTENPGNVSHVPADGNNLKIEINGKQYSFASGPCSSTFK